MPATDSAMASPMGASDMSSGAPGAKMTNGWMGTAILGALAFGLTAILFGLSQLPKPYSNGFVAATGGNVATDLTLGGLVLVLVGLIGLFRDHAYWGAVFLGFGAFWISWSTTGQGLQGYVLAPGVGAFAIAGLAFIWLLFTLTFLISSMKHGWGSFFGFLFLFIAFILILVEAWTLGGANKVSSGEQWAVGGLWIFTGLVWWLKGTADLTNHTYGRRVIPF
jgi:succinate-acetate transporter protein